jgi:hypothetical protein
MIQMAGAADKEFLKSPKNIRIRHSGASRTKSPGAILNSRRLAPKGRNTGMYSVIQSITDFVGSIELYRIG